MQQSLSLAHTLSSLTKVLSPLVPALQPYEPAIEGIGLILKSVKTGGALVRAENEYRVITVAMSREPGVDRDMPR